MKNVLISSVVLLAVLSLTMGVACGATDYTFNGVDLRVEAWAYSSSASANTYNNEAMLVVDFANAGSYAFGYRWEGGDEFTRADTTTVGSEIGEAMMLELDVDTPLVVGYSHHSVYGFFMSTLSYDGHTAGAGGWSADWVGYWNSTDGGIWTPASVGISTRVLTNGAWDGWSQEIDNDDFDPLTPPVTPTPEPATMLLLGGMAVSVVLKRRRRK